MRPIEDFLKQLCISQMNAHHTENWNWFAENIKDKLDSIPIIRGTAFTPHDFSHHCYNIYRIISDVLVYKQNYGVAEELSSESLYLLNIAILFHDYSMTKPNFSRLEHSKESEEMFLEFCRTTETTKITTKQRRIIAAIIYAHSDIKEINTNGKIETKEITIKNSKLVNEQGDVQSTIYVKFLAGLLRLADELDLTQDRVEGYDHQIKYLDTKDAEQAFSLKCWEQIQCFDKIFTMNNDIILSVSSEKYSKDSAKANSLIGEAISKANEALSLITDECFQGDLKRLVRCSKIKADFSQITIGDQLGIECTLVIPEQLHEAKRADDKPQENVDFNEVNLHTKQDIQNNYYIVNPNFSNELDAFVIDANLFVGGHFNINSSLCSRDWIETKHIINDKSQRSKICSEIKKHMILRWTKGNMSKVLIVGIEEYGALIASNIAFDLQLPFSYIIPEKTQQNHSMQDKRFSPDRYSEIILFTDVIVSCDTIKKVIKDNNITGKVIAIYTVFRRPILNYSEFATVLENDNNLLDNVNIYALNEKFAITLFAKSNCPVYSLSDRCSQPFTCIDCHNIKL